MKALSNKGETLLEVILSIALFAILFAACITQHRSSVLVLNRYKSYSYEKQLSSIAFELDKPIYKVEKSALESVLMSKGISYSTGELSVALMDITANNGTSLSCDGSTVWLEDDTKKIAYVQCDIGGINVWGMSLQ